MRTTIRRGMTILELLVALFVLTTAMAALVQLLAVTAGQRRLLEQRRVALQEVANQAERVALLNWNETAGDKLISWSPSADLQAVLPLAKCTAAVSDEAGSLAGRRIQLSVAWTNAAGQAVDPITLTVWRFAPEAQP
jgi:prepilin-type N-terminal cleavage/methylation domain-containing protein